MAPDYTKQIEQLEEHRKNCVTAIISLEEASKADIASYERQIAEFGMLQKSQPTQEPVKPK